jgi:hypothetical protein
LVVLVLVDGLARAFRKTVMDSGLRQPDFTTRQVN